ncbi:MAG: molybdopterin-dependent oxidoreductase [Gammaproteobacteria bacterium]|nr:molybdopterin-dependent oxidoreductase [Gammaproteobacteria bacterium]
MTARERYSVIGKARRRVDGRAKVLGQTRFADDLTLPRMVHAKLLRSPHPHAEIVRVDTSRAAAWPGVLLVLTGADFPIGYGILPVTPDEYPLARERVRYVGDPVAAVVARDERTAEAALAAIEVEYRPLRTIADAADALAHPEPRLHAYSEQGNIHRLQALEFGDVEEALAGADRVFEDLYFYQGSTHLPIEQHAALAALEPDGRLALWSSTQVPHYLHRMMARVLGRPAARVRIVACPNGGGFGGKTDLCNHEFVVARAAERLGRPVKICLTREEVFYMHRGRHPVTMRLRTGVTQDGRITGMHLQTLLDGGAYASYGVASVFYTGALQAMTYEIPRYKWEGCRTFTNKPPCGPKRGHGTPQPRFAQEVQLDRIAEALEKDPAELRLGIVAKPGSLSTNWFRIGSIGLAECIDEVVTRSGWRGKHRRLPQGRGVGIACGSYMSGVSHPIYRNAMPLSGVQILLDRSGQVTVFSGATEVGQGSDDVLAALVAEVLGIGTDDVRCVTGDTALTPVDLGSYSSRVTLMMGNAAIAAAERVRGQLAEAAAAKLETTTEAIVFAEGRVFRTDDPARALAFHEAVIAAEERFGTLGAVGSYTPPPHTALYKGGGIGPSPAYSYTACVVEVAVDEATGWVSVEKVWIAHDIGRTLNRTLAEGQVIGSVYMALGEALMEEQAFRRLPPKLSDALVHRAPSMLDYKSPTALDMPEVDVVLVEDPDPNGPFGAKEVGQGPLLPVMPALANAVYDAIGVRIDEVPVTPGKILRALERKARGEPARVGPEHFPDVPYPEPLFVPPPWEGGDGREIRREVKLR